MVILNINNPDESTIIGVDTIPVNIIIIYTEGYKFLGDELVFDFIKLFTKQFIIFIDINAIFFPLKTSTWLVTIVY